MKLEKEIYRTGKKKQMTWGDIKHLELEDDDVIHSEWIDDENFDYHGYWHGEITRMVEETDEQKKKRVKENERFQIESKERRRKNYLKLKEEFEKE